MLTRPLCLALALLALAPGACTTSPLVYAGRPCSAVDPCGGGLACDPVRLVCVEGRREASVVERGPGEGGPREAGRPDGPADGPRREQVAQEARADLPRPDLPCTPTWSTGAWSACSKSCGTGTMTRSVSCVCGGATLSDASCPTPKPDTSGQCTATAGCTYSYLTWSSWGVCAVTKACTKGQRTRTRECQRSDGVKVSCSECGGVCTDTQPCCSGVNTAGGTQQECDSVVQQCEADCIAAGCSFGGPTACTVGGSPSCPTCWGAQVACN